MVHIDLDGSEEDSAYSTLRMSADAWNIIRLLVFMRDDFTCRRCTRRGGRLHCDHITPLSLGGTNNPFNLQTLCAQCNRLKRATSGGFVIKAPAWRLWDKLIAAEPRLVDLYQRARSIRDDLTRKSFCANVHWYDELKPELVKLVGWSAWSRKALLRSSDSYDVAYEVIYNVLPDCRNCWCMGGDL